MSANPTRVEWDAPPHAEFTSPLQEGNRVLESIARQEAMRALLAFSDLHEQIRNRRLAGGRGFDRDLFETERFILDEVLQLICDRAQTIMPVDGILVALAEGPDIVCRAASGPRTLARGVNLPGESEFLQECLQSGHILRCDDCETDPRVRLDFTHAMQAGSTVVVPLRGRREQLGVLQAFSNAPRAFTDQDVRCLDLFAELVLSALKPEDQDRRIGWLSDVAGEILQARPASGLALDAASSESGTAGETVSAVSTTVLPRPEIENDWAPVIELDEPSVAAAHSLPTLGGLDVPGGSRPGLGVALSLVVVAALLAGAGWLGIQHRDRFTTEKKELAHSAAAPAKQPSAASPPTNAPSSMATNFDIVLSNEAGNGGETADGAAENKTAAKITGVRHWSSTARSTVVIDMGDEVPYEVHRLASPERIYFDLHGTVLAPELKEKTMDIGDESLTRVRIGQPAAGVTRVVLDTKEGSNFSVSMESSPYRLVVELSGAEKTLAASHSAANSLPLNATPTLADRSAGSAVSPAPAHGAALPLRTSDQPLLEKNGRFRIVLDAGHGGWDLGTVGRRGLLEKNLVLDVTQRLGKLLAARLGSEVMFTRSDDTYLALDQRADIANQAQADLFVSVHANYSSSAAARGVETYYTNLFAAPGSRELEKHEDGTISKLAPVSLSLGGLHEKIEESRRLAASVQRSLHDTLASNNPEIRNRGIKDAAFLVLTGTTMPAILTEISFVSSPADERNLQDPAYRQRIAEALYQGIARYEQSSPRTKIAQLQTRSTGR